MGYFSVCRPPYTISNSMVSTHVISQMSGNYLFKVLCAGSQVPSHRKVPTVLAYTGDYEDPFLTRM